MAPNQILDSLRIKIIELATKEHINYLDIHQKFLDINVPQHNQDLYIRNLKNSNKNDGVHPTALGYKYLAEKVYLYLIGTDILKSKMNFICFGDSITFGAGSPLNSYPTVLQSLINKI